MEKVTYHGFLNVYMPRKPTRDQHGQNVLNLGHRMTFDEPAINLDQPAGPSRTGGLDTDQALSPCSAAYKMLCCGSK